MVFGGDIQMEHALVGRREVNVTAKRCEMIDVVIDNFESKINQLLRS